MMNAQGQCTEPHAMGGGGGVITADQAWPDRVCTVGGRFCTHPLADFTFTTYYISRDLPIQGVFHDIKSPNE